MSQHQRRTALNPTAAQRPVFGRLALVAVVACLALLGASPAANAQNEFFDEVALALENKGYFVEDGADGTSASFADLVDWAENRSGERWYFASFAEPVDQGFADDLRDVIVPQGNVLLFFYDSDDFVYAELASDQSEATEERALATLDGNWENVEDFMRGVVDDVSNVTASTGSTGSTSSGGSPTSSGSGFSWWWLGVPAVGAGGVWWSSRRRKQAAEGKQLEDAEKIRAEVQSELDELANDVLVLASPVDLSENAQATQHYRDATEAYSEISDLLPDPTELENANLAELSDLGARIVHARWQMDAAEALMAGEPVPEKPKVEPPPAPPKPPTTEPRPRPQMPQRQPRPRRPYSGSRRSGGGGLLDILIAGSGMLGRGTRYGGTYGRSSTRGGGYSGGFGSGGRGGSAGGGMFGGGRDTRTTRRQPRGGGVFGGGAGRSSRSRRTSTRSSSRSSGRSRSTRARSSSTRRRSSRRRR